MSMERKKLMKKKILFAFTFALSALGLITGVNAAETLPAAKDGKITLTEDVALVKEFKVNENQSITIDLAGHTLTGPENLKPGTREGGYDGYTINSFGSLKIIDSGTSKGKIICPSDDSSCIRNYKTLEIDGVSIESNFISVKNEEASELTIKNSNITSYGKSSSIQNYGNSIVTDSIISATNNSVAIFALTYRDYSSKITINNSFIDAKRAILTSYDNGSFKSETASSSVIINGGSFSSDATIVQEENSTASSIKINGEVTGPAAILPYTQTGSIITLNEKVSDAEVPEGVKVNTSLDGAEVVVNSDGTISVVDKKTTVETTKPAEENKITQKEEKNPNTADNIGLYFVLALVGLGVVGLTTRSLVKHN